VLSASLPKEFNITDITNPLKRKAANNTSKEEIMDPRPIPRKPEFQTS
jgi:hypothetical protein